MLLRVFQRDNEPNPDMLSCGSILSVNTSTVYSSLHSGRLELMGQGSNLGLPRGRHKRLPFGQEDVLKV